LLFNNLRPAKTAGKRERFHGLALRGDYRVIDSEEAAEIAVAAALAPPLHS